MLVSVAIQIVSRVTYLALGMGMADAEADDMEGTIARSAQMNKPPSVATGSNMMRDFKNYTEIIRTAQL